MCSLRTLSSSWILAWSLGGSLASAQTLVARINAGGPALVDGLGQSWSADQVWSAGGAGYVGGSELPVLSRLDGQLVGGDDNPLRRVYATGRVGWTAYRFDVPAGEYILRLTLAEIWNQGPGLRSLDVAVEGVPFLADVDLAERLGVQYGGQVATRVHVADGHLDLVAAPGPGLDPAADGPLVCGLELWSAPASFPAPPAVRALEARASYGANLLSWAWESEPTLAGWRIWRADEPADRHQSVPSTAWTRLADLWAAPARYHDRTASVGRRQWYRVAALGLDGQVGARSAPVSATALNGADSTLRRYELALDAADQLFIDQNILAQPDEEVPASFTFAGDTRAAEVRYRGNSARFMSKKSWKIKFSAADAFEGRRALNLKASFLDASLIREALAQRLFTAVGQSTSELRPVHLAVNGIYRGVFNEVEQVDENWLAARDRATGGDLFKVDGNLTPLPTLDAYQALYEKETNTATGHAALIALVEFLDSAPTPSFLPELADVFDLDAYLDYLAVIAWTADLDSVLHNYYLHQDLTLGRWELLPWDTDLTFAIGPNQVNTSILYGSGVVPGEPVNGLRRRVLAEPALLWRFCEKLSELQQRFANPAWLTPEIDAAAGARRADAHADPFKLGWEHAQRFEDEVAKLRGYAALRAPRVAQEIAVVQPPAPPTTVWINELAAEAQDLFFDEALEFEDWLELTNAGPAPVDLGGLFLTDDLGDPTRWALPAGTLVPAGGHVVVWCDGEPGDGPLHAPFTLAAAGGELGLFGAGAQLLDFATWQRQVPDVSYGRTHDAGPFFEALPTPTAGTANTTLGNLPPSLSWVVAAPPVPRSSDAVAVTCRASDADGLAAVELHWRVNGGSFATLAMLPLGAQRFGATIPPQVDGAQVEYYLTATDVAAREASKPAEGAAAPYAYLVLDAALTSLKINEFLASNASGARDEAGDLEDWIELGNASASALDLSGLFLSDDLGNSTKWAFPAGSVIAAGGELLVWCDDEPGEGPLHATFKLSAGGEDVALFDALAFGNGLLDGFHYAAQTADVAFGSLPDGASTRFRLSTPSPGASNAPPLGGARAYEHSDPAANPLDLAALGPATIGGALGTTVSLAPASSPGALALGLTPQDLSQPGLGFALVVPNRQVPFTTSAAGTATIGAPIPNDSGLIGLQLYAQALVAGGGFSNGLVWTIGP